MQDELLRRLWGREAPAHSPGLRALPAASLAQGLSVYRENAKALSVRALGAAFPRVAAWLGPDDWPGLAWAFARAHPPAVGDAAAWGEALPGFLSRLPGMEPTLPALACLDWTLHRLAVAEDDPAPDPGMWTQLQTVPPKRLRLRLSPHVLTLTLPPLVDVVAWAAAQAGQAAASPEPGTALVLWRQQWQPMWAAQGADEATWLALLQEGVTLAEALDAVLLAHPDFDLGAWLPMAWGRRWLLGADELSTPM